LIWKKTILWYLYIVDTKRHKKTIKELLVEMLKCKEHIKNLDKKRINEILRDIKNINKLEQDNKYEYTNLFKKYKYYPYTELYKCVNDEYEFGLENVNILKYLSDIHDFDQMVDDDDFIDTLVKYRKIEIKMKQLEKDIDMLNKSFNNEQRNLNIYESSKFEI
jgi:hypothetical protein